MQSKALTPPHPTKVPLQRPLSSQNCRTTHASTSRTHRLNKETLCSKSISVLMSKDVFFFEARIKEEWTFSIKRGECGVGEYGHITRRDT